MKKIILFAAIAAVTCMFAGCEQNAGFSVAPNKYVKFAPGNLQYTQSTDTWAFAAHQYEFIGAANVTDGALSDKIDLFGWSGSAATAKWGVSLSKDNVDYSGDFADWRQTIGDGATWRTLTKDEWDYVLRTRTNASTLKGVARIQISESEYANGLILLPDNWQTPSDVTFKSSFSSEWSIQAYADYQTFTLDQWNKLEAAGAVFLPASGYRGGSLIDDVQYGGYWSATPSGSYGAYDLGFGSGEADTGFYGRSSGQAVRLVRDVK